MQTRAPSCQPFMATTRGAGYTATGPRVISNPPAPPVANAPPPASSSKCPPTAASAPRQQQTPPSPHQQQTPLHHPPPDVPVTTPAAKSLRPRHLPGGRKPPPPARPQTAGGTPRAPRGCASTDEDNTTGDGGQPREQCGRPGGPAASTVRPRGEPGGATLPQRRGKQRGDGQRGGGPNPRPPRGRQGGGDRRPRA